MKPTTSLCDPDTITDLATFSHPVQVSCGIEGVWVDGEQVWDGTQTGKARPGRVLLAED